MLKPVFRDRVKDFTSSTGTGDVVLMNTPPPAFKSFGDSFPLNVDFEYCILDNQSGLWETGLGYLSSPNLLTRASVHEGYSGIGIPVAFTVGIKNVYCTPTSQYMNGMSEAQSLSTINAATRLIQTQRIMAEMVTRGQAV